MTAIAALQTPVVCFAGSGALPQSTKPPYPPSPFNTAVQNYGNQWECMNNPIPEGAFVTYPETLQYCFNNATSQPMIAADGTEE